MSGQEIKIWDPFVIFNCSCGQWMRSCRGSKRKKLLGIKGILMFQEEAIHKKLIGRLRKRN